MRNRSQIRSRSGRTTKGPVQDQSQKAERKFERECARYLATPTGLTGTSNRQILSEFSDVIHRISGLFSDTHVLGAASVRKRVPVSSLRHER